MGKKICFCISTCAFCEVDDLSYQLLGNLIRGENFHTITFVHNNKSNSFPLDEIISELDDLFSAGLLAPDNDNHLKLPNISPPITALALIMATDCNLRCDYCYAEGGSFQSRRELMSLSVAKASVDFLVKNSRRSKEIGLSFFGGEPLLNYDCITDIVAYAQKQFSMKGKKCSFGITTNGILLTPEKVKFILENDISLIISIDGPPEVHNKYRVFPNKKGSYESIVKNISKLSEKYSELMDRITIRATFTGSDHDLISRLSHLRTLGFTKIALESCAAIPEYLGITSKRLEDVLEDYKKATKWYKEQLQSGDSFSYHHFTQLLDQISDGSRRITQCGAGRGYLSVSPDGTIYPCHRMVGNEEFAMGNIFDGIVAEMQKFWGQASVPYKEKCMNCWARYICGGGCHATAIQFNKDILQPYEIDCELMKHRIKLAAWLYSEMADYKAKDHVAKSVC